MAPRKDKNKIINDADCSPAASKRRRIEILNGVNGVSFTNPSAHLLHQRHPPPQNTNPSAHLLHQRHPPPQNTTANPQLSPPSPGRQNEEENLAEDDGFISSLIPQQNFIINYHVNLMLQSVEEFWRENLAGEIKRMKEIEILLKEKGEQMELFRQMYHYYEEQAFYLEEKLLRRDAGEGCSTAAVVAPEEDVQSSCLVNLNSSVQRKDKMCKNCQTRMATSLWLPCRHLCVCLVCERRVKSCPMCGAKKTESFDVNLP